MADVPLMANPMTTQDDIIVGGASGVAGRLGKGTDGQVLTVDPSTHHLVWADPSGGVADILDLTTAETDDTLVLAPDGAGGVEFRAETGGGGGGGLVFLEAHTASSSASLAFTSAISSTYDEYLIEGVGLVAASNAVTFQMQFSSDGGANWLAGSTYEWFYSYLRSTGGNVFANPDTSIHLANAVSNATDANLSFTTRLYNPNEAVRTRVAYDVLQPNSGDSGNMYRYNGHGSYLATTALDAVRFLFSSGNIASGTIRVYGLAKS